MFGTKKSGGVKLPLHAKKEGRSPSRLRVNSAAPLREKSRN
jgi:hypothetical protein